MISTEISNEQSSNSRKWLLMIIAVAVVVAAGYAILSQTNATPEIAIDVPETIEIEGEAWWNNDFSRRLELSVDTTQEYGHIQLDHAQLVSRKLSRDDAKDIRVVSVYEEITEILPTQIKSPNSTGTKIIFPVDEGRYFLYYGNPEAEANEEIPGEVNSVSVTDSEKQLPKLVADKTKDWALIINGELHTSIELTGNLDNVYAVNPETEELFDIEKIEDELIIKGEIAAGTSGIFFVTADNEKVLRSNTIRLKVSYPLYVAWSIDWEGEDVREWTIDTMDNIANTHGIPLTQFFNPRIFIDPEVDTFRQDELTNYVKARQTLYGDEIGMHMHMYYDMVEAAGLEPKATPRWGSGLDGYDVLTSGYSYDEFSQILDWALDMFAEHNLPTPKGYRAGGWFADLEILKAVQDAGFVYDSSGRTEYKFGSRQLPGHWDLTTTTQPYYPSSTDQNVTGNDTLSLLEMPNNGNDSYWFTAEELLQRFRDNYPNPGEVISEVTLLTYLSHPDWFEVDQPKLESLFAEISKYKYKDDNGPVVYTTLQDTLSEYL